MNPKQSLLHNPDVNTKGKVSWNSSSELLQQFVEEGLNLCNGEWSSPGGDGKLFEHDDTSIIGGMQRHKQSQSVGKTRTKSKRI